MGESVEELIKERDTLQKRIIELKNRRDELRKIKELRNSYEAEMAHKDMIDNINKITELTRRISIAKKKQGFIRD